MSVVCERERMCMSVYVCMSVCEYLCESEHECVYECEGVCVCVCVCVCVHMCLSIYIQKCFLRVMVASSVGKFLFHCHGYV